MNSKLAKYLRASMKAAGFNPYETNYRAETRKRHFVEIVGAIKWVRVEVAPSLTIALHQHCGRARYQFAKRLIKRRGGGYIGPSPMEVEA